MRVWINGKEEELYTIGQLSKMIKRSIETIRVWEREQIIPKAMYKRNNIRLYHPLEVEAMKKVVRKQGRRSDKDELRKAMWDAIQTARREILNESEGEI